MTHDAAPQVMKRSYVPFIAGIVRIAPIVVACVAMLVAAPAAMAQATGHHEAPDSAAIVSVVERFHAALARGDSADAASLLDPSAVVLESGAHESRSDYLAHHLPADIAFARAVPSTRRLRHVRFTRDAAWVVSTSRTTGRFNDRPVDSDGAELMVLTRTSSGWRIAAIHWSSRRSR